MEVNKRVIFFQSKNVLPNQCVTPNYLSCFSDANFLTKRSLLLIFYLSLKSMKLKKLLLTRRGDALNKSMKMNNETKRITFPHILIKFNKITNVCFPPRFE